MSDLRQTLATTGDLILRTHITRVTPTFCVFVRLTLHMRYLACTLAWSSTFCVGLKQAWLIMCFEVNCFIGGIDRHLTVSKTIQGLFIGPNDQTFILASGSDVWVRWPPADPTQMVS